MATRDSVTGTETLGKFQPGLGLRLNPIAFVALLLSTCLVGSLQITPQGGSLRITPLSASPRTVDERVIDMTDGYDRGSLPNFAFGWPFIYLSRIVDSETGEITSYDELFNPKYRTKVYPILGIVNLFGWSVLATLTCFSITRLIESYVSNGIRIRSFGFVGAIVAAVGCLNFVVSEDHMPFRIDIWQRLVTLYHLFFATIGIALLLGLIFQTIKSRVGGKRKNEPDNGDFSDW